jgi:small subunit ribosomal protein S3
MGQKINPTGFRMGTFIPWKSRWFAEDASYKDLLIEDIKIREVLMERLKLAGITDVEIERLPKSMNITLTVSRPGVVIGRGGTGIEDVKKQVLSVIKKVRGSLPKDLRVDLQVQEIKNPELSAHLVATRVASDLERRMPHRRVVSRAMERVMQAGAKGIKMVISGRIGGVDIARAEQYHQGSIPAQTLRANIDYAHAVALLKKGYVGIKIWIYKEEE